MDLQWTSARAPHCVVLLLILLSQWAVEYASSDLPFPLLMLIVIDISCTQRTRPGPLCSGPENHRTLATIKSLKRCNNPPRDITIAELRASVWCNVDPISLKRFCCHLKRLWPSGTLCVWRATAFIFGPFIIPVYFSPVLHSSIRPFISPSISSYRLCSTCGSICQGLCDACALVYRHLSPTVHLFSNCLKYAILWRNSFHFQCQGIEKLAIILPKRGKKENDLFCMVYGLCNSLD